MRNQQALVKLIEGIADNKYVLGDRLVEVGFSGPDIESTLSSVAIAQGELGHARILYNWSLDLKGHKGRKPDHKCETGKSFREVREINSWVKLIASFYTVNLAIDIVMESLAVAENEEITAYINKVFLEHKEHCVYSEGWALKLLNDQGGVPRKFEEELNKVLVEAKEWLKEIEENEELRAYLAYTNLTELFQRDVDQLKDQGLIANV
ncbi:Phenylacetic acid catabolic protein [Halalkalibacter krulwichiae]|uniref:Phenylacetic acid catabolic protein n=1 Tax=Halalkalibacter krulwichiae TaxID=199441 RepID=A0A1X9MAX8_9BACI|nr:Phenylacetic acid catabolic protein [Halalkalibacter krulwichiae]ARK29750.1 Phenylacetic acid catabolic protein [Halalkalibacter krulwichiae]